jgi:hypothetical protein
VVADKAQAYWPRLEGLAPWFLRNANCQDTYELLSRRCAIGCGWKATFPKKDNECTGHAEAFFKTTRLRFSSPLWVSSEADKIPLG